MEIILLEDNVKLHGVTIESNLNINNHISEIWKKKKKKLQASKIFWNGLANI
jgi:hypothetical protein